MVAVVICLIGLLVGSCFGIFFSGEDTGTGQTIRTAIAQVNQEYQDKLEEIRASHPHDGLEITGSQAAWKEVLAVYAVKTTTALEGQDVASMDEEKLGLLAEVFWEMNQVSARVETRTETSEGEGGAAVETEVTVLVISVSHKTAQEMAAQLGFDDNQKEQLQELLSPEYDDLWNELLYGIALGSGNGDLVAVAPVPGGQRGRRAPTGVGMVSPAGWNGAPSLSPGVPINAGCWNKALFPNFPGAAQACSGSSPGDNGCPAAPRRSRECSSSLNGTAATPSLPTMWALWNGWKTAVSTPLREIPMTWCVGIAILWDMGKSRGTVC